MTLGYGYTLNLQKENIILSLIKIDTLNFTMYFLKDFDMPFKNILIGLYSLISMNILFTIKDHSFY